MSSEWPTAGAIDLETESFDLSGGPVFDRTAMLVAAFELFRYPEPHGFPACAVDASSTVVKPREEWCDVHQEIPWAFSPVCPGLASKE